MRRKDREVTDVSEILDILERCQILYLGLCDGNMPYVVPMNFGWRQNGIELDIYLHCATEGKKLDIIAKNQNACFAAECGQKLITSDIPCKWSAEYASVMGEGTISIVDDVRQKEDALSILMRRYGFKGALEFGRESVFAVTVLKLAVTALSGKRQTA